MLLFNLKIEHIFGSFLTLFRSCFENYIDGGWNHMHNFISKKLLGLLDPRVPILWPSENVKQIRQSRDFRLSPILLIFGFLDLNFFEG